MASTEVGTQYDHCKPCPMPHLPPSLSRCCQRRHQLNQPHFPTRAPPWGPWQQGEPVTGRGSRHRQSTLMRPYSRPPAPVAWSSSSSQLSQTRCLVTGNFLRDKAGSSKGHTAAQGPQWGRSRGPVPGAGSRVLAGTHPCLPPEPVPSPGWPAPARGPGEEPAGWARGGRASRGSPCTASCGFQNMSELSSISSRLRLAMMILQLRLKTRP